MAIQLSGSLAITGSLTATSQIVAQTLNVQQVTSSIVYSSGSNIFGNSVSNTQQFTGSLQVSSSTSYILGNLGVGTTSPGAKLDVFGGQTRVTGSTNEQLVLDYATSAGGFSWQSFRINGTNKYRLVGNVDNSFGIYSDVLSAYTLAITSGGNVGIGTTSPGEKLVVNGGSIEVRGTTYPSLALYTTSGTNWALTNRYTSNRLSIDVIGTGEVVNILSNGNVGIGTTSPGGKLHIAGDGDAANLIRLQHTGTGGNGYFDINVNATSAGLVANYSSTAIPMLFLTGATERMRITEGGNVGIGTTSPGTKLQISGANNDLYGQLRLLATGAGADAQISFETPLNGRGIYVDDSDTNKMKFYTGAGKGVNDMVTFDNSGNVGIGNTSPQGTLHIGSALASSGDAAAIILKQTSTTASTGIYLERSGEQKGYYIYMSGASDALTFQRNNSGTKSDVMVLTRDSYVGINTTSPANLLHLAGASATPSLRLGSVSSGFHWDIGRENLTTGDFVFNNANGGGTSERMRITVGGNVGIGTTSPSQALHVNGYVRAQGISVYETGGTISAFIGYENDWIGSGTSNDLAIASEGSNNLKFYTNGTTSVRMMINTSGNVGIGTTSPSYKLHVVGTDAALDTSSSMRFYINRTGTNVGSIIFTTGGPGTSNGWGEIGQTDASGDMYFKANPSAGGFTTRMIMRGATGHIVPGANGTQNLGSDTERWATVFTSDLSLSNGIGDYTIVEGEEDLFLYNNKTNKVYKFVVEEVDPSTATPKKS